MSLFQEWLAEDTQKLIEEHKLQDDINKHYELIAYDDERCEQHYLASAKFYSESSFEMLIEHYRATKYFSGGEEDIVSLVELEMIKQELKTRKNLWKYLLAPIELLF